MAEDGVSMAVLAGQEEEELQVGVEVAALEVVVHHILAAAVAVVAAVVVVVAVVASVVVAFAEASVALLAVF